VSQRDLKEGLVYSLPKELPTLRLYRDKNKKGKEMTHTATAHPPTEDVKISWKLHLEKNDSN